MHQVHASDRGPFTLLNNTLEPGHTIRVSSDRANDVRDVFDTFYRLPDCSINSLDLHEPFHPPCKTAVEALDAFTDGTRPGGFDAPFMPFGCDMRWFDADQICDILSRFGKVHIIGDSMMRNLAVALNTFIRRDFIYGPRAQWMGDPEGWDCTCAGTFHFQHCIWASAFSSSSIWEHDPTSMKCPKESTAIVEFNPQLKYPLTEGVPDMARELPDKKPTKPHVFVYGHGIWNNLTVEHTQGWIYQLVNSTVKKNPWLQEPGAVFPKLFVSPTAAGEMKPEEYREVQGNVRIVPFTKAMREWAPSWGAQHLGMFNATLESSSPDGTHAGMKANMLKAMMVLNWMNAIDVSGYTST